MKTNIYIDGFNLYYGALKGTAFKWLDVMKLCQTLLPNDEIASIKYFTARVAARPDDPDQPIRQQTYFRALRTISNLEIIEGRFLTKSVRMPVANPSPQSYVQVIKTEEKGSDVNLAVHLLHDAYRSEFELAAIVSNDSDLLEAIRIVQKELNLRVGVLNPQRRPSVVLQREAFFVKNIYPSHIRKCEFANPLADDKGVFHKPIDW